MVDGNKLAHELHGRRKAMSDSPPRCQAAGEALFCQTYEFMPTLDDFDVYMDLMIDVGGVSLSVAANTVPVYELTEASATRVGIFVFTLGEKLKETEILGWLPASKVAQAPVSNAGVGMRKRTHLVDGQCLYPMPEKIDFDDPGSFVEPQLNVPTVWDYNLQALWTPLGFHVYDAAAQRAVQEVDGKI